MILQQRHLQARVNIVRCGSNSKSTIYKLILPNIAACEIAHR